MATKQAKIVPQYVEFIPESLSDGTLYISRTYKTAVHKCCCGCGEEVVTPLMSTEWTLSTNKDGVSLYPSIGNWSMPCRSHYWIRNSKVIWAGAMSKKQIDQGREYDRQMKEVYFADREPEEPVRKHWLESLIDFVSSMFKK